VGRIAKNSGGNCVLTIAVVVIVGTQSRPTQSLPNTQAVIVC